jgi:hypothetical protein
VNRALNLVLVAAAVMGLLAVGSLIDGPSDIELEQAVAADLQDATEQARREAQQVRVELARLEADDHPRPLLPTREQLQRVAMLEQQ